LTGSTSVRQAHSHPSLKPTQLAGSSPVATFRAHKCRMRLLCCCKIRQAELTVHDAPPCSHGLRKLGAGEKQEGIRRSGHQKKLGARVRWECCGRQHPAGGGGDAGVESVDAHAGIPRSWPPSRLFPATRSSSTGDVLRHQLRRGVAPR